MLAYFAAVSFVAIDLFLLVVAVEFRKEIVSSFRKLFRSPVFLAVSIGSALAVFIMVFVFSYFVNNQSVMGNIPL